MIFAGRSWVSLRSGKLTKIIRNWFQNPWDTLCLISWEGYGSGCQSVWLIFASRIEKKWWRRTGFDDIRGRMYIPVFRFLWHIQCPQALNCRSRSVTSNLKQILPQSPTTKPFQTKSRTNPNFRKVEMRRLSRNQTEGKDRFVWFWRVSNFSASLTKSRTHAPGVFREDDLKNAVQRCLQKQNDTSGKRNVQGKTFIKEFWDMSISVSIEVNRTKKSYRSSGSTKSILPYPDRTTSLRILSLVHFPVAISLQFRNLSTIIYPTIQLMLHCSQPSHFLRF